MNSLLGVAALLFTANLLFRRFVHIRALPRPQLGLLERWYASQPQRRRVAGAILDWKLDLNATQRLVDEKQARFKLLRCKVVPPVWEEEEPAKPIPVELVDGNEDWESCMACLLSENPESIEPLVRIALNVREQYLVVRMDHVLTDGQGFARFMGSLCGNSVDDVVEELPPVPESNVCFDLSFTGLVKRLLGGAKPGYVGPLVDEGVTGAAAVTQVRGFIINAKTMQSLQEKCHAKQTTITALMAAVATHTLSLVALNQHPICCHLQIPVSLRKNNNVFGGNFVAPFEMNLMDDGGIWNNAIRVREQLCKELPTIQHGVGMLVLVKDFQAFQLEKQTKLAEKRGRSSTIEVSNLGKLPTSSSPWFFAQANHYVGPLFALNLATCNGTMHCTVTTSSNAVSIQLMNLFCSTLVSVVNNLK